MAICETLQRDIDNVEEITSEASLHVTDIKTRIALFFFSQRHKIHLYLMYFLETKLTIGAPEQRRLLASGIQCYRKMLLIIKWCNKVRNWRFLKDYQRYAKVSLREDTGLRGHTKVHTNA